MRWMMLVGLIITVAVWSNYGPWWGLVAGFLLMGGLGWKLLAAIPGAIAGRAHPGSKEFIDAWEARFGEMQFGQPRTYPPPGLFRVWEEETKTTHETAGAWLDRQIRSAGGGPQLWTP